MTTLPNITTSEQLTFFLSTEKNAYKTFINKYKKRTNSLLVETEFHHILPLYANGPNKKWNLIQLSVHEHQMAHQLLYDVYKNTEDLCALRFRKKKHSEAYKLRIQLAHQAQRLNKKGFFNSNMQSENGKKGGKAKSLKKRLSYIKKLSPEWKTVLSNESRWLYVQTKTVILIKPFECLLPQDVAIKLLTHQPFQENYKAKLQSFTSNLSCIVRKQRKKASGWVLIH